MSMSAIRVDASIASRPRRVLHVSWPTDGGTAQCVYDVATHQAVNGWDVLVACPAEGWLSGRVAEAGVPVTPWRALRRPSASTWREVQELVAILERFRPDVAHLHSSKAGLAGRLAVRGRIATIFQPHAWSFEATGGVQRALSVGWERWAVRWADVVVCVSAGEVLRGRSVGIRAPYRVVTNGVDVARWTSPSALERASARERFGLDDVPVVVCIGRLTVQKGQDVLLKAWKSVRRDVPTARLIFVGDGPEAGRLRSVALPGVEFVGEREDVPEWLAAADVVAIPSRWDGMSIALLEALARGKSIVATDVPGVREVLRGDAGAVVAVENTTELAAALTGRLLDPGLIEAEGAAARVRAVDRHDVRRTLSQMEHLYDDVYERRAARRRRVLERSPGPPYEVPR
jgi:glycosyltransferase involved in cell wall biosynthesis